MRANAWLGRLLLALSLAPSAVWVARDDGNWAADPAWYGQHALRLAGALGSGVGPWLRAMIEAQGAKAPAIAWLGQWFVPPGAALGSIDKALLASILLTQLGVLLLLHEALLELFGRPLIALCGAAALASSPLFVELSRAFYAEPLQALAAAWFLLAAARAARVPRAQTLVQLAGAASLAMAAKISSPVYCAAPALLALRAALKKRGGPAARPAALAAAALFAALTAAWYAVNGAHALSFAVFSAGDGPARGFGAGLLRWLGAAQAAFFAHPAYALAWAALAVWAAASRRRGSSAVHGDRCAWASAASLVLVLAVFSASAVEPARYLLAALIFPPVILAWSLRRLDRPTLTLALIPLFVLEGLVVHGRALRAQPEAGGARELPAAVRAACGTEPGPLYGMIGAALPELNADSADYLILKDPALRGRCWLLGPDRWSADLTRRVMDERGVRRVVLNDPERWPIPESEARFNESTPELLARLRADPSFKMSRLGDDGRLLLFER